MNNVDLFQKIKTNEIFLKKIKINKNEKHKLWRPGETNPLSVICTIVSRLSGGVIRAFKKHNRND